MVWEINTKTELVIITFKITSPKCFTSVVATCSSTDFVFGEAEGVILSHTIGTTPCSYILSARANPDVKISKCLYFDPNSPGSAPWFQLKNNGCFDTRSKEVEHIVGEMACGIATKALVRPGRPVTCEMSLVWDMPVVHFPKKLKEYSRYYTKHFGKENAGVRIVHYAFENYPRWEREIYKWQSEVLEDRYLCFYYIFF